MDVLKELHAINEQRSEAAFNVKLSDWQLPVWGNAMAGEAGEACNIMKKMHRGDFSELSEEAQEGAKLMLAEELADIIIYIDLIAKKENINLEKAIVNKFNKVSDEHGCDIKLPVIKWKCTDPLFDRATCRKANDDCSKCQWGVEVVNSKQ